VKILEDVQDATQHIVLRLPPGSRSFNCPNLTLTNLRVRIYEFATFASHFMSLPSLPLNDTPHSSNIHNAAQLLHSYYETTRAVLSSGNHNRHRLQHHAHLIFNDALPLLLVLEEEVRKDKALVNWLQDVSERFLGLTAHLLDVEAEAGDE
jgi:hypothetical protein